MQETVINSCEVLQILTNSEFQKKNSILPNWQLAVRFNQILNNHAPITSFTLSNNFIARRCVFHRYRWFLSKTQINRCLINFCRIKSAGWHFWQRNGKVLQSNKFCTIPVKSGRCFVPGWQKLWKGTKRHEESGRIACHQKLSRDVKNRGHCCHWMNNAIHSCFH